MLYDLKKLISKGKSILAGSFSLPEKRGEDPIPDGVTADELIKEAREYVESIMGSIRDEHVAPKYVTNAERSDDAN